MSYNQGLTDTQLRATPVVVSGNVGITGTVDTSDRAARLLGHVTVDNASIAVTGAFWQATQPVSLAVNTPDVTDRAARLLGHVTVDNASIAVTGAFFQATQPVSLAVNTPDVTDRAARLLGHVTVDNASIAVTMATQTPDVTDRAARLLGHVTVDNASIAVTGPLTDTQLRATPPTVKQQSATTVVSVLQTTANTAQAAAVSLAAAGAGLFHYITSITIQRVNNTATAVAADTVVRQITSANFGSWAHEVGSTLAAGGIETFIYNYGDIGIRSAVANTLTSFSMPAGGAGTKFRITVTYYTGT